MKYANPITDKISITYDGNIYSYEHYLAPTNMVGITDENYPNYDASTIYNTGDFVIIPEIKRIFKCTSDGVQGIFPPSDPIKWIDWGFVNSYKMLATDEQIGEKTEGTDIQLKMPTSQVDVLALLDCQFISLQFEQIDNDTNEVVKKENIIGKDIGCTSFAEYFYTPAKQKSRVLIDLEWLPNSATNLIFNGEVKIGTLVEGYSNSLGVTLYGTSLNIEDRSKIQIDEFTGFRRVLRYGHVRILDAKLVIDASDWNDTVIKLSSIVSKNILFIPTQKDCFSEMTNLAYIERVDMPVDNPTKEDINITLVGVAG